MPVRSPMAKQAKFLATLSRTGRVRLAAEAAEVNAGTARSWRKDFPEFDQAWEAAAQAWKELLADEGLQAVREIIADETHKDRFSAAKWATERVEGPIAATQRVELSQPAPFVVEHRRGLTVADLLADPRAAGLVQAAIRELPPASEVLAEPGPGVDPAGDLPAGSEP